MPRARRLFLCALTIAAVAPGCSSPAPAGPRPQRQAVVRDRPGEIRTIPEAPDAARASASQELGRFLADVYSRAFLPPIPVVSRATTVPTPIPRPPLADVFTEQSRPALEAGRAAFEAGDGVGVRTGVVGWSAVIAFDKDSPVNALLTVDFTARGTIAEAGRSVPVRLRQSGQLLCLRTELGWRVAGFDVQLGAERQVPRDTPAASPVAFARFMPGTDSSGAPA